MRRANPWMGGLALALLASAVTAAELAPRWGSFNGLNAQGQAVTSLIVDEMRPSKTDPKVQDLLGQVQLPTGAGTARWVKEVCHRRSDFPRAIWCDGNRESPLYGSRYLLVKTQGSVWTEKSEQQRWQCQQPCNKASPEMLLYER
ncbi:hypothetical protein HNP55_003063 [Paucibacter oligotrophus]|uniref:Uncharacterized protein n=1 Tax=Roseateles oligotrophus TaxID=1769250 RepID=A0A840LEN6_9BURK|nr:hypothetical protein [Roseateles oligotrophus]MBB4844519.1 hypothetical protein [Roseateles oligotrophus]